MRDKSTKICCPIQANDTNAIGFSGADGNLIQPKKTIPQSTTDL
jgi:acetylglutamate kinase